MDSNWSEAKEWITNLALMSIGVFNRLVFGNDRLTFKQLVAFYVFCIGVVWIVSKLPISDIIKSSITLCCGLVILPIIKGVISGGNKSEDSISNSVTKRFKKWFK